MKNFYLKIYFFTIFSWNWIVKSLPAWLSTTSEEHCFKETMLLKTGTCKNECDCDGLRSYEVESGNLESRFCKVINVNYMNIKDLQISFILLIRSGSRLLLHFKHRKVFRPLFLNKSTWLNIENFLGKEIDLLWNDKPTHNNYN